MQQQKAKLFPGQFFIAVHARSSEHVPCQTVTCLTGSAPTRDHQLNGSLRIIREGKCQDPGGPHPLPRPPTTDNGGPKAAIK